MLPKHLLTEDEARAKWCPYARSWAPPDEGGAGGNRVTRGKPDQDCLCIASDCMAWRDARPAWNATMQPSERKTPRGYCGAAGPA